MGKASEEWKGKWKTGRKLCVGRSQVLQKVNQIVIVLMMKKIPISLQSTHSVMCIRVISHRPNKNNSASACRHRAAVVTALPQRACSSVDEATHGEAKGLIQYKVLFYRGNIRKK